MNRRGFIRGAVVVAVAAALPAPAPALPLIHRGNDKYALFAELYGANPANLRMYPYQQAALRLVSNYEDCPTHFKTLYIRGSAMGKTKWLTRGNAMHENFIDVEKRVLALLENKTEIQKYGSRQVFIPARQQGKTNFLEQEMRISTLMDKQDTAMIRDLERLDNDA